MDYNGCKGGYQGDKYIRGTTYSAGAAEAMSEAQTIAALNGEDAGNPGSTPEHLATNPQQIWSQHSTYGPNGGTFPYKEYSGYFKSGFSNPQYEWDQKGTYGPTNWDTTYPYDSYSGYHDGIYPTLSSLSESHQW